MIRLFLLILSVLGLASCTVMIGTAKTYPQFRLSDIPSQYKNLTVVEIRKKVSELELYDKQLDAYIESVYNVVLRRPYLTRAQWEQRCSSPLMIPLFKVKRADIQDNSSLTDRDLIHLLIQYINQVRADAIVYNTKLASLLENYNKHCTMINQNTLK